MTTVIAAPNDYSANAQPVIQAAMEAAYAAATWGEGVAGDLYLPPGIYRLDSPLLFHRAIKFRCEGYLYYTPASGSAVIIGDTFSQHQHMGYDIDLGGIRHVSGNAALPTGINASGGVGLEIRRAQASRFRVRNVDAFNRYGIWINSSNNAYVGQHVQGVRIDFGYISYCGGGIMAESASAADGAAQAIIMTGDNLIANYRHMDIGKSGDVNCNHFQAQIGAMESQAPGGTGVRVYGYDNDLRIGYIGLGTSVRMMPGSSYNRASFLREKSQVTYTDSGFKNKAFFADQTTTP